MKPSQKQIQAALLAWYRKHRRDLPWRRTKDPYAIWVSEVMLQQTQVTTVKPYFERFLREFPTVQALAQAPLEDALKAWEGLGYYSRTRNLHRAAQIVAAEHKGALPRDVEGLLKLPGIGRYTAGAIASIAFGLAEPALDGNVARVLSRLFRVRENSKEVATRKKLWALARKLIPAGRASLFNQALMDLGATVCIPREPRCLICPLHALCQARVHNEQNELPVKAARRPTPHYDLAVGVVWKGKRCLLVQRTAKGLLGGLWEFPGVRLNQGQPLQTHLKEHLRTLGLKVRIGDEMTSVDHAFTHFRITAHAFHCVHLAGEVKPGDYAQATWITCKELERYPLPKTMHKLKAFL